MSREDLTNDKPKMVVVTPRRKWWQFWKLGSKPKKTNIVFDAECPAELTKGHSWEQVGELTAASILYMHRVIPAWEALTGLADPSQASVVFQTTVATPDAERALKDVQFHWNNFIKAIRMHGGLKAFCAEYRKALSPADKAGWDRLKNDAAKIGRRKEAAARGEALIAFVLVIAPMTAKRAEAMEWFDAIVSAGGTPPYPFDLIVAEGPNIHGTILICLFENSNGTPNPLSNKILDQFVPWLKIVTGGRRWYELQTYGPKTFPPGTDVTLERWFGSTHIVREATIAPPAASTRETAVPSAPQPASTATDPASAERTGVAKAQYLLAAGQIEPLVAWLLAGECYGDPAEVLRTCNRDDAAVAIIPLLKDPSSDVRTRAAYALGPLGGVEAAKALCEALRGATEWEEFCIAEALGRLAWPGSALALTHAIGNTRKSGRRASLAEALVRCGDVSNGLNILYAGLSDDAGSNSYATKLNRLDEEGVRDERLIPEFIALVDRT